MSDNYQVQRDRSQHILLAFAAVALGLTAGGAVGAVFPVSPWAAEGVSVALGILAVLAWPRYKTVSMAAIWVLVLVTASTTIYLAARFFAHL